MVFASLEFLTLFLPAFLLIYAVVPASWRNTTLLLGSWVFYGWWSPTFLLLFVGLTVAGWAGGQFIAGAADDRARLRRLWMCMVPLLAILCWYKYINITVESVNVALGAAGAMPIEWQRTILPIGLSFIVLQSLSYLIDVQRRVVPADHSLSNFGAYQSMFVHLIAGPIIRYDWVKRELVSRTFDWAGFATGSRRFMIGMAMKVLVADTLAPVVDTAFALTNPSFVDAWIGCLAYTLQLFFDFAGYSAMAIGLGLMLGFKFPENFNHPYLASSIQDFWRRWHISLSSWLRDYLYIPLGGNRGGTLRTTVNLFLTMSIAGLWHGGDSWNFLLWGMAHGVALCLGRWWSHSALPPVPALVSRVLTLLFVVLAWTLFRAHTFDIAMGMYAAQLGLTSWALSDTLHVLLRPAHGLAAVVGLIWIISPRLAPWFDSHQNALTRTVAALWPAAAFLLSFALIASRGAVPFLYFQF